MRQTRMEELRTLQIKYGLEVVRSKSLTDKQRMTGKLTQKELVGIITNLNEELGYVDGNKPKEVNYVFSAELMNNTRINHVFKIKLDETRENSYHVKTEYSLLIIGQYRFLEVVESQDGESSGKVYYIPCFIFNVNNVEEFIALAEQYVVVYNDELDRNKIQTNIYLYRATDLFWNSLGEYSSEMYEAILDLY